MCNQIKIYYTRCGHVTSQTDQCWNYQAKPRCKCHKILFESTYVQSCPRCRVSLGATAGNLATDEKRFQPATTKNQAGSEQQVLSIFGRRKAKASDSIKRILKGLRNSNDGPEPIPVQDAKTSDLVIITSERLAEDYRNVISELARASKDDEDDHRSQRVADAEAMTAVTRWSLFVPEHETGGLAMDRSGEEKVPDEKDPKNELRGWRRAEVFAEELRRAKSMVFRVRDVRGYISYPTSKDETPCT